MNIGSFNAQTSELDLTARVKGRELQISLHQENKRVRLVWRPSNSRR